MYVSKRIVRNSLLCGFIFASASDFQISNAKIIQYTVPSKGAVYGNVATGESWSVNARNVRTTGYGAAGGASASRASYGFSGKMVVSRAFFQAWLAYEIGNIGLEWIRQQYEERENSNFNPETLEYEQSLPISKYTCENKKCYWYPDNQSSFHTDNSLNALHRALQNAKPAYGYMVIVDAKCYSHQCEAIFKTYDENGNYQTTSGVYAHPFGDTAGMLIEQDDLIHKHPAGEPTIDPDPYLTAAILDQWAHIVPQIREAVSDYVDFLQNPQRYREIDPQGNVLQDFEGVLEPMEEPISNPHKTAKRPEPEIEPTPELKTKNRLNGNEITQPTEPIKDPTTQTSAQEKIDLSKIEDAVTKIGADPADTPVPELNLKEWGEIEITTPKATEEQINEQAGKIRKTVTEKQVIQKAEELIEMHAFNYETFGKSKTCPPPRKMRLLTVEFDLPFDLYCDYIKQIVMLMIGLIPLGVFIYFLKNLFIHG